MAEYRPIPIGVENFREITDKGFCFVDNTLLIKDLLDGNNKTTLFTRPRRFGKTLNMSMIQHFFEKTDEDNSYLFKNLDISRAGEKYTRHMGQYPVISLSLKSMKQSTFEQAFIEFRNILADEF